MMHLLRQGPASIADIARREGQSHQLVSSRIAPLEKAGLLKTKPDPKDERRKILEFTVKGAADARKLEKVSEKIAAVFRGLNEELGVDLMAMLEDAEQSLLRNPVAMRIKTPALKKRAKAAARAA
jgi:DNA-binding MarR family transcriptional regulator